MIRFGCIICLIIVACHQPEIPSSQSGMDKDLVFAQYSGGQIVVSEVRQRFMEEHRTEPTNNDMHHLALRIAVERNLAINVNPQSLRQDQRDALQILRVEDAVQLYLKSERSSDLVARSDEASKRRYTQIQDQLNRPERRVVNHLFRASQKGSDQETIQYLESLRLRASNGESFQDLAKQYSESENALNGGALGLLTQAQLPEEIGNMVFSMDRQTISNPVKIRGGYAIFFVEDILSAVQSSYSDYINPLTFLGRIEAQTEIMREFPLCEPTLAVSSNEPIPAQLTKLDPQDVLMKLGSNRISVLQFQSALQHQWPLVAPVISPEEWTQLYFEYSRLLICTYVNIVEPWLKEHSVLSEAIFARQEHRIGAMAYREAVNEFISTAIDQEELKTFFKSRLVLFHKPMQATVDALCVPVTPERLALATDSGNFAHHSLAEAAAIVGGEVEHLNSIVFPEGIPAKAWQYVSQKREPGRLPLFHFDGFLYLIDVIAFEPPREQPFENVKEQVRQMYVLQHIHELEQKFLQQQTSLLEFQIIGSH